MEILPTLVYNLTCYKIVFMKKSFIIGGILIFILVSILVFLKPFSQIEIIPPEDLVLDYSYEMGVHSFSGKIELPNSCYDLIIEDRVLESDPEQISLLFSVEKKRFICKKDIITESFSLAVNASSNAMITTFFNQEQIDFNLNIIN